MLICEDTTHKYINHIAPTFSYKTVIMRYFKNTRIDQKDMKYLFAIGYIDFIYFAVIHRLTFHINIF